MSLENAKKKASQIKLEIKESKTSSLSNVSDEKSILTLNEFYNTIYIPYIKKSIKSYESNMSIFKNHILPTFGNKPMDEIKKSEVMGCHSDIVYKKKLSNATANKFLIFFSHAYNLAKELEIDSLLNYNPTKGIKHFIVNNERQRFLTKSETKRILNEVNKSQNIHLKYIIPMLILSGCRRGELLKAKRDDFDTIQNIWTIPTSKSGKKRVIPITPLLSNILNQIPKNKTPYLFVSSKTNKPYTTIFSSWNRVRCNAKLCDVRLHDLRHTFASALVNSGRSLYEVQTLLGHSTAKMTQRYAHLSNDALMDAASCAGKLM